jgi:hypothetical protein
MESHFRLHASAMHMMMDALEEKSDDAVRRALQRAAAFAARQSDTLSCGVWFLHDELELTEEAMHLSPYTWTESTALGKSRSNMLVLNTHLDTTIALERYARVTGDRQYASLVESARKATRAVIALRSVDWLYRILFAAVRLGFLPEARQARLPLLVRVFKRIGWKYIIPRLHSVKARLPRLVMPGGYIDRALTLRSVASDYHAVNLMDLLRYPGCFPQDDLGSVVEDAVAFVKGSGVAERWGELDRTRYALGFWAEALYHLHMRDPCDAHRALLAEAILQLCRLGMGLPGSLLGANGEVVRPSEQVPCPSARDPGLRVINLSRGARYEFLVVNVSDTSAPLVWEIGPKEPLVWTDPSGLVLESESQLYVESQSWVKGVSTGSLAEPAASK